MLKSYEDQLLQMAAKTGASLLQAFERAGVNRSTYYRTILGSDAHSHRVAVRVAAVLEGDCEDGGNG